MSTYKDIDAVIEAIQKCDYSYREYGGEWKYIGKYDKKMIIDTINKLPTADVVEVVHGEWVNNMNGTYECSICGIKHSRSNYCPNCGADMRGGTE